ncbi:MAG: UDP binding domain-containing protein, partial [Chloroflexota bacterium]|nr:UDP binding domain-containing protein [Chloroflexota bacterium]
SILPSNRRQIDQAYQMIKRTGSKSVGVLGFSFKAGTDDLRESPMVELIEYILGKGYKVRVYDKNVSLANLQGANRAYIEQEIPHIATLMADSINEVLAESDVIVIGNGSSEFKAVLDKIEDHHTVIDLVRIVQEIDQLDERYQGICW